MLHFTLDKCHKKYFSIDIPQWYKVNAQIIHDGCLRSDRLIEVSNEKKHFYYFMASLICTISMLTSKSPSVGTVGTLMQSVLDNLCRKHREKIGGRIMVGKIGKKNW